MGFLGDGSFWESRPLPHPQHGDRSRAPECPGACVLEGGEGPLRLGTLRLCAGLPPSAGARNLQGRLDSWHRRRWHCQESGALASGGGVGGWR